MGIPVFMDVMSGGKWLKTKRTEAGLSQGKLAQKITDAGFPVTSAYISIIEREYDKNKKGLPTRVNEELVDAFAKALNVHINEARIAFNYAPTTSTHYINGYRIELPDDVSAVIPFGQINSEEEAQRFKEAFMLAYEMTKKLIERERIEKEGK